MNGAGVVCLLCLCVFVCVWSVNLYMFFDPTKHTTLHRHPTKTSPQCISWEIDRRWCDTLTAAAAIVTCNSESDCCEFVYIGQEVYKCKFPQLLQHKHIVPYLTWLQFKPFLIKYVHKLSSTIVLTTLQMSIDNKSPSSTKYFAKPDLNAARLLYVYTSFVWLL